MKLATGVLRGFPKWGLVLAAAVFALSAQAVPKTGAHTKVRRTASAHAPAKKPTAKAVYAPVSPHRKSPYVGAATAVIVRGTDGSVRAKTLFSESADAVAYPASVTKLMTALLVLEDVRAGRYALADQVTATPDVYKCEPSWIGIKPGETISVNDLLLALMVESANDAAIALGVKSAGSIEAFVARMNARAAELGMTATRYYNPNGLPPNPAKRYPWKSFNVSTASDQLKLAVRLLTANPEIVSFTSVKTCDLVKTPTGYRVAVTRRTNAELVETRLAPGETLVKAMRNHNNVMVKNALKIVDPNGREAADGLKTGYIDAGGSSVILTGSRAGRRAIVVVLGSQTSRERDEAARRFLEDALGAIGF